MPNAGTEQLARKVYDTVVNNITVTGKPEGIPGDTLSDPLGMMYSTPYGYETEVALLRHVVASIRRQGDADGIKARAAMWCFDVLFSEARRCLHGRNLPPALLTLDALRSIEPSRDDDMIPPSPEQVEFLVDMVVGTSSEDLYLTPLQRSIHTYLLKCGRCTNTHFDYFDREEFLALIKKDAEGKIMPCRVQQPDGLQQMSAHMARLAIILGKSPDVGVAGLPLPKVSQDFVSVAQPAIMRTLPDVLERAANELEEIRPDILKGQAIAIYHTFMYYFTDPSSNDKMRELRTQELKRHVHRITEANDEIKLLLLRCAADMLSEQVDHGLRSVHALAALGIFSTTLPPMGALPPALSIVVALVECHNNYGTPISNSEIVRPLTEMVAGTTREDANLTPLQRDVHSRLMLCNDTFAYRPEWIRRWKKCREYVSDERASTPQATPVGSLCTKNLAEQPPMHTLADVLRRATDELEAIIRSPKPALSSMSTVDAGVCGGARRQ
jgi:hypothetical protein